MAPRRVLLLAAACMLAGMQLAAAGCAGEIFDCNGAKNPCANKQCGSGMVCRTDNCRGCFAKCEPPGMVHIMSLPAGPSAGAGSSNGKVTSEAGPGPAPACPCPRILAPVCGADGKKYNNKCLAECAKTTVTREPDASGNCPKAAAAQTGPAPVCPCPRILAPVCGADGNKYDNKCLAECAKTTVTREPDANGNCPKAAPAAATAPKADGAPAAQSGGPRPSGFTCRCSKIYKPVCGSDGKMYDNACLAICEGIKVSEVQPDVAAKKCNM